MNGYLTTAFAAAAVMACSLAAVAAPEKEPAKKPVVTDPVVNPKDIWPANLTSLAGKYVFAQVASPGGFWETTDGPNGATRRRQVSMNEVPAAFRDKLLNAEISITINKGPLRLNATQKLSPSKRGFLRFYEEEALGSISVRNLPGVGGGDDVDVSGPAYFRLDHQSHSNPTVSGILHARKQGEPTWGAATLDYADLAASTVPKEPEAEGQPILSNARVLRSGTEIFAYVEWRDKDGGASRSILGSVRLERVPQAPPPAGGQDKTAVPARILSAQG